MYNKIKSLFILLCLLWFATVEAQTKEECNALIKAGIEATTNQDYTKSLEILAKARSMAEQKKWYDQQFDAINGMGKNYFFMFDYGECLKYCLEAYNLAVKELDEASEGMALNNVAVLYVKDKNYDKAYEYFRKAYDIALRSKQENKIALSAVNLGEVANKMNRPDEARLYIQKHLGVIKKNPMYHNGAEAIMIESDLLSGKTQKARNEAFALLSKIQGANDKDMRLALMITIAKTYSKEGKYADAIAMLQKVAFKNPDPELKKDAFTLLAEVYAQSGNLGNAVKYKDSLLAVTSELNDINNGRLFESNRVKFDIENYKNQIAAHEEKLTMERTIFFSVLGIIVALITISILFIRQRNLIKGKRQNQLAFELEKEKNENLTLRLEQEALKNEIETRNRKLSAKALYLSSRNELIEEIITSLSKKTKLARDKSLIEHINTLKNYLRTDKEWDTFLTHFEEVNNGLLEKLKTLHPWLTPNDIRFIAYIYMNLSAKEIASILNITLEACRKRKERLTAKLGLHEETSIYDYLSGI